MSAKIILFSLSYKYFSLQAVSGHKATVNNTLNISHLANFLTSLIKITRHESPEELF